MSDNKNITAQEAKKNTAADKRGKKTVLVNLDDLKPGMTVRVHEKIKEKVAKGKEKGAKEQEKERLQVFEGMILSRNHNKEIGATITVRKVSDGIGVEKIFPINSPSIAKIEAVKMAQVRRAKLGFLRHSSKKLKESKI